MEQILGEVRDRVSEGAREITLLGQTVNSYRHGHYRFGDLLRAVAGVDGVERVPVHQPTSLLHDGSCDRDDGCCASGLRVASTLRFSPIERDAEGNDEELHSGDYVATRNLRHKQPSSRSHDPSCNKDVG